MRIIAGKYRRRTLLTNPGQTTRPYTSRVKVILFDRIRDFLPGKKVLDVFAGTGTLGLESLSRGAESAVIIESDHRAHELLRKNVASLKADEHVMCWRTDAMRCSYRPKGDESRYPYDVIFFDPPYEMIQKCPPGSPMYKSLQRLARPEVSNADVFMILRTPEWAMLDLPPEWSCKTRLEISRMWIHWLVKTVPGAPIETIEEQIAESSLDKIEDSDDSFTDDDSANGIEDLEDDRFAATPDAEP